MRKFLKSFPGVKFMAISILAGMLVGLILGGDSQPRGVIAGAGLGVLFIIMMATRNFDPEGWEAVYNPQAYDQRQQLRKQADKLQAIVVAYDQDDDQQLEAEVHKARKFLEGSP